MIGKQVTKLKEPVDELPLQLIATELDTSASFLHIIDSAELTDAIESQCFNSLIQDITNSNNGVQITAFDDHTDMYEYREIPLVVHNSINRQLIIYDKEYDKEIESLFRQL